MSASSKGTAVQTRKFQDKTTGQYNERGEVAEYDDMFEHDLWDLGPGMTLTWDMTIFWKPYSF